MDEASTWLARLDKKLSAADAKALQEWMAADPGNRNTLLKIAELWDSMDSLSRLVDLFPVPASEKTRQTWFEPALVATVVLAVLAGLWHVHTLNTPDVSGREVFYAAPSLPNVYQTAGGEHSHISLPDGTQLGLNTNSLLRVDYTNQHRLVVLERGEVSIRVARDNDRLFSVIAGERIVQAIGTEFNLEITSEQQIELVVTEGKVRVGVHRGQRNGMQNTAPILLSSSALTVSAGEELLLGSSAEDIKEIEPEEIEVKLSWRDGNLIFRGESLEEAVADIGRYSSVDFIFLDDDLKKVRIAGLFRAGDVDGLLATLRENFDISYQRNDDGKVLLSSQ
jgi:transmembrane sensor